ncbi:arylesterase [Pseudoroseicyclus tamaricis]|uniref:arylesterase n=1 Tax=Pseudoroseicyclus tamaricis TaxID=2705421 RepID=UPI001F289164|nr:arylesterase [Pseudoroseicyclus tamaricis]
MPAAAEDVILAFGDSLTAGYGLPVEEGFVPQLEGWLRENGAEVEVINGGVSGDTTAMGRQRLAWALGDAPDLVILELGANDMLRGMDPAAAQENLAAMIEEIEDAGARVLLVGVRAASNYGAGYRTAFEGMFPELAEEYGLTLYENWFSAVEGEDLNAARAAFIQSDGLHPNAEGVERIVDDLGPVVLEELDALDAPAG